jgi:uncharacterized protein (DUF1778 family)
MQRKGLLTKGTPRMTAAAPKKAAQKVERLEARLSPSMKELFQEAATMQGRSLTDFVINSALEAAKRTVRQNELVELSRRDRIAFVEALLNPPPPNDRLQRAMQRNSQAVAEQ